MHCCQFRTMFRVHNVNCLMVGLWWRGASWYLTPLYSSCHLYRLKLHPTAIVAAPHNQCTAHFGSAFDSTETRTHYVHSVLKPTHTAHTHAIARQTWTRFHRAAISYLKRSFVFIYFIFWQCGGILNGIPPHTRHTHLPTALIALPHTGSILLYVTLAKTWIWKRKMSEGKTDVPFELLTSTQTERSRAIFFLSSPPLAPFVSLCKCGLGAGRDYGECTSIEDSLSFRLQISQSVTTAHFPPPPSSGWLTLLKARWAPSISASHFRKWFKQLFTGEEGGNKGNVRICMSTEHTVSVQTKCVSPIPSFCHSIAPECVPNRWIDSEKWHCVSKKRKNKMRNGILQRKGKKTSEVPVTFFNLIWTQLGAVRDSCVDLPPVSLRCAKVNLWPFDIASKMIYTQPYELFIRESSVTVATESIDVQVWGENEAQSISAAAPLFDWIQVAKRIQDMGHVVLSCLSLNHTLPTHSFNSHLVCRPIRPWAQCTINCDEHFFFLLVHAVSRNVYSHHWNSMAYRN